MEANQIIKIVKKNIAFLLILASVGAILGYYSNKLLPSGFKQTQVFFVTNSHKQESSNFIGQDPAINFTDSAANIIPSPDFLVSAQIYQSTVEVKKLAPQLLRITVTSAQAAQSQQDLDALVTGFNAKIPQLTGDDSIQLTPVGASPQAAYFALNAKILTLFGALLGTIVAITIVAVFQYLKL